MHRALSKRKGSPLSRCAPCDGFRIRCAADWRLAAASELTYAMARRPASVARQAPSHSMPPAVSSASMKNCGYTRLPSGDMTLPCASTASSTA